ncbi:DEAD/DEAH box helicase [Candidatus Chlorohelix sp.]|uniref:DEAD/DEAH box helicase n=1 Tax=Candidatus Chlorohelix sp. TaxID=3139201 RepID=UPI00305CFB72
MDVESEEMIAQFRKRYPFPLDPFQEEAIRALAVGESVMVTAPTGTGKTVVAEFGIFRAYTQRKRVFYTTPIKALSNQKFKDLREQYGDAVGLLTGDIIENPGGHIIVMTTEVMRNMLLQSPSEFTHTTCVVFDEIHYLADSERGTTWEESIILCPKNIQLVCLSATISNAQEVASWISQTHRPTRLISHTKRSIPLALYYFLDGKLNQIINNEGKKVVDFKGVGGEAKRGFRNRLRELRDPETDERKRERPEPTQRDIVEALEQGGMLPAIYFMFSRNDCEVAAELVALNRHSSSRDPKTLAQIDEVCTRYLNYLDEEDRKIQQVKTIITLVRRGFGFHHAGLLPILKQLVEELFSKGLMNVVFATDTLALGVNMPAKTVVIGRLTKFDGQTRRPLIPNEFQQMAGRAGRRGLDVQGHVVVPYSPWITFEETILIATGPLLPVESAFSVRYNSVLNLYDPPSGERILQILRNSLMEFQQSRRLRELALEVQHTQKTYDLAKVGCLSGLPEGEELLHEYDSLGHKIQENRNEERRAIEEEIRLRKKLDETPWHRPMRETLRQIFRTLPPGTLIHCEQNGWGIYIGRSSEGGIGLFIFGDKTVKLDEYRTIDYLPPERFQITLPDSLLKIERSDFSITECATAEELNAISEQLRQIALPDLATWLREARQEASNKYTPTLIKVQNRAQQTKELSLELKEQEQKHPCHSCDVRKKHRSLQKDSARLLLARDEAQKLYDERKHYEEGRLRGTLNGLISVLKRFNFIDKEGYPSEKSLWLRDVFDTNGLIIIEMVSRGWLEGLQPQDLAEVFSWFAYDRDFEFLNRFVLSRPLNELRKKLDELEREIFAVERQNELQITNGYNIYYFGAARAWCRGVSLSSILEKMQLAEGDIIITFNKTLDLMRQVQDMLRMHDPNNNLIPVLSEARHMMRRGVVEQIYNVGFGVVKEELETLTEEQQPKQDNSVEAQTKLMQLLDEEDEETDEVPVDNSARRRFSRKRNRRT